MALKKTKETMPLTLWDKQNENLNSQYINHEHYISDFRKKAISRFEWLGLPTEIDERYLEFLLFAYGTASICYSKEDGKFILGTYATDNKLNAYMNPTDWNIILPNTGKQIKCSIDGLVPGTSLGKICWDNSDRFWRTQTSMEIYAKRLGKIDAVIDNQVFYQSLPPILEGSEEQKRVLTQYYQMAKRTEPVVIAVSDTDLNQTRSNILDSNIAYKGNELWDTKTLIKREADEFLGITPEFINRVNIEQSEQLQERVEINRLSYLNPRRQFAKYLNMAFGLSVEVKWAKDNESAQHWLEVNPQEFPEANVGQLNNAVVGI